MSRKSTRITASDPIPCQLYLSVCASGPDPEAAAERVEQIVRNVAVPSMLVMPRTGETLTATQVLPFLAAGHAHGVAVMIADDACLARTVKADGVHLTWSPDILDRYSEAREIAGGRLMIGADVGRSRHDAMTLAEAGAEYIAFGTPPGVGDQLEAEHTRQELIGWWAEVFEVPCVACDVDDDETALDLGSSGADFVCIGLPDGQATGDLVSWASGLSHSLESQPAVAA